MCQFPSASLFLVFCAGLALGACTPVLDWRELHPADSAGVVALMPCRAVGQQRELVLAGRLVHMTLHVCDAAGRTWALALADVADPAVVDASLVALGAAAAANVGASSAQLLPLAVSGATPQPASRRQRLVGRRPDGLPIALESAVFSRGTHVFQATVLGKTVDKGDAETFFSALRFAP